MKKITKKLFALALSAVLALTLVACSSGDSGKPLGKYKLMSMSEGEETVDYDFLALTGMQNVILEFNEDGSLNFTFDSDYAEGITVNYSTNTFSDPTGQEYTFEKDGDTLSVSITTGSKMVFVHEDSKEWDGIETVAVGGIDDLLTGLEGMGEETTAPETTTAETTAVETTTAETTAEPEPENEFDDEFYTPTATIEPDSIWYGYMDVQDYTGPYDYEGYHDVWGFFGEGANGRQYFEIYSTPSTADSFPLVSFYINMIDDTTFEPVIDEEAFLFDISMKEEDYMGFYGSLANGTLFFLDEYSDDDEKFYVEFYFREDGKLWYENGEEILPPSYFEYKDIITAGSSGGNEPEETEAEPEETVAEATDKLPSAKLKEIYETITGGSWLGLPYDEVIVYFEGVEGVIHNDAETFINYRWISQESETSLLSVTFNKTDDGLTLKSMSLNNIT